MTNRHYCYIECLFIYFPLPVLLLLLQLKQYRFVSKCSVIQFRKKKPNMINVWYQKIKLLLSKSPANHSPQ